MSEPWKIDGKPALVILHMQDGMLGEEGFHPPGKRDANIGYRATGVLAQLQTLLKAFRSRNLPRVFISAMPNPLGHLPAYGALFRAVEASDVGALFATPERHRVIQKALEILPEMERQPDEPVLINWLLGAFTNSGLDLYLRLNDVKTVVLAGFSLSMVVYNTAIQAADHCYSCIIPRDASTSGNHAAALQADATVLDVMAPRIALVTTTQDVIAHL